MKQLAWLRLVNIATGASFAACLFIMDYLKTEATFWKKERSAQGDSWLDARQSDVKAKQKWS